MKSKPLLIITLIAGICIGVSPMRAQLVQYTHGFAGTATTKEGHSISLLGMLAFYDDGYTQAYIQNTSMNGQGYVTGFQLYNPGTDISIDSGAGFSLDLNPPTPPFMPLHNFAPTGAEANWSHQSPAHQEYSPLPDNRAHADYSGFTTGAPPHTDAIGPNSAGTFGFWLTAPLTQDPLVYWNNQPDGPDIMLRIQTAGDAGITNIGLLEESAKIGLTLFPFEGTITPVPEPGIIGLLAVLALPLMLLRRRKRKVE
ncbi:MAG: PEP-CTERM sorting domain-containing protein [Opitutales bacterium]|nr:PEP-CTERM sorting domain-containing protein [Opitutales bacterium]